MGVMPVFDTVKNVSMSTAALILWSNARSIRMENESALCLYMSEKARILDENFWETLDNIHNNLPDIKESQETSAIIAHLAIISIVGNWMLGLQVSRRSEYINVLFNQIAEMEKALRDIPQN